MPTLVVVRLRPSKPMSGQAFADALSGLHVTAFDLTFADSANGVQLGSAGTVFTSSGPGDDAIDLTNDGVIVQHYVDITVQANPPVVVRKPQAAATAVIVASPPAGHPEYPTPTSFDLRLTLDRSGPIADHTLDFNAVVQHVTSLPTDENDVIGMPPSAYATIPPAHLGVGAHLELSQDGTPPAFADLVLAIDAVLADDPADGTPLEHRGPLSAAQSLQVARELVWDRTINPPPDEPIALYKMYTSPPDDPSVTADDAENDRNRFEAELDGYYATYDAQALALAGFVFSASTAMLCERLSAGENLPGAGPAGQQLNGARAALLPIPLPPNASDGSTLTDTAVLLTGSPAGAVLDPPFVVPAAFFYALGPQLPSQVDAGQRFAMATADAESKLLTTIQAAQDAGLLAATAAPVAASGVPAAAINAAQAARRLRAIGQAVSGAPNVPLTGPAASLVTSWLTHDGPTGSIDTDFWQGQFASPGYLDLLLHVITDDFDPLIAAIKAPPLSVTTAAGLLAVPDDQWRTLFLPPGAPPRLDLMPPFTQTGPTSTPSDRVEAFLRHLKTFFSVPITPQQSASPSLSAPPVFPVAGGDVLLRFAAAYLAHGGGTWTLGTARDATASSAAVLDVFPGDAGAQAWLTQALDVLDALFDLTSFAASPPQAELRFALMEALYARGFTTVAAVRALSPADFRAALDGSVAYPYAADIQTSSTWVPPGQPGPFRPVNPDGTLVDCVPPEHRSPFGPVAYLHDLLGVTPESTCEDPYPESAQDTVAVLLAARRGPLGDLHATAANVWTPIPAIDLVNESLEALAAAVADGGAPQGGAVFDTAADKLAGHLLAVPGPDPDPAAEAADACACDDCGADSSEGSDKTSYRHDPTTLFRALPEHSAPAVVNGPAAATAAYQALSADAAAPQLPYDQPLDVDRSYLEAMGGSRYEAMRRFRRDIAEFVLDPAHEPAGFGRPLWRYPVRLEIALEYLCIGAHEYATLFAAPPGDEPANGVPAAWQVYGFPAASVQDQPWTAIAVLLPELLTRTGLAYCELVDLQESGLVPFGIVPDRTDEEERSDPQPLPKCEPCCLGDWRIAFPGDRSPRDGLVRMALAVRLWRLLGGRCAGGISFATLADLDTVLHLFIASTDDAGTAPTVGLDPEFLRQLAALLILCEDFGLPLLADPCDLPPQAGPADRVPLLALWTGTSGGPAWARAVRMLLDGVEDTAERTEPELRTSPELLKVLGDNLRPLSQLCGFDPAAPADTWWARPTHTLRFAEVLLKIYRSRFTVGELLFLYTTDPHLAGDDPFPLQDEAEAASDPFALGDTEPHDTEEDAEGPHSLWALRRELRSAAVADDDVREWSWPRITAALRQDLGYVAAATGPDALEELGRHLFAHELERIGMTVPRAARRYTVPLAPAETSPLMWADTPFRYDGTAHELSIELPLRDAEVLAALLHLRPLRDKERRAVRDLYFAPRAALAPFAGIFENPVAAIEHLVQHGDSSERFGFFAEAFALFHRRCELVARHLAWHVLAATGDEVEPEDEAERADETTRAAWRVLRALRADENLGQTPWEDDSGAPPDVTWSPLPSGGAFAALLGLLGTGLVGEFGALPAHDEHRREDEAAAETGPAGLWWRETRGPLNAFDRTRNAQNAPAPTVIPAPDLQLTAEQARYVGLRNGLALLDATGEPLGGAQRFAVRWRGVLIVEHGGRYRFHGGDNDEHDESCEGRAWRLVLNRGQRRWTVLNHDMPGEEAPGHRSGALHLRRGAYEVIIDAEQRRPRFGQAEDARPSSTGFRFGYDGPDTQDAVRALPFDRLFRASKDGTLGTGVVQQPTDDQEPAEDQPADEGLPPGAVVEGEAAALWLESLYTSSIRDIRRSYQRAFKSLLIAHRAGLSAHTLRTQRQSELGYLLDHAETFAGTSYPRTGPATFGTHRAWFDLNLLPVGDPYPARPPGPAVADQRSDPSPQRRAALFDTWERLFDYGDLRRQTRAARERPAWVLFDEVSEQQPDDPAQLLRHLGIDLRYAALVSAYAVSPPEASPYLFGPTDLEDERWAIRAWRGATWLRRIEHHLVPADVTAARPDLWAADDPAAQDPSGLSGVANLTAFVQAAYLENGAPRRYADLELLNDGLRERARGALVAYLCAADRVTLPGGTGFARGVTDLSDLLLQDVATDTCRRVTRIEDAVSAVQAFVQRAVLGLEPSLPIAAPLLDLWQCRLATFREWQGATRRAQYRENWIEWDELRQAQRYEAFRLLERRLREDLLTVPVPGGLTWWPGGQPPRHPALELLQDAEPDEEWLLQPPPEGLGLLGRPERVAQPSWLSPVEGPPTPPPPGNGGDGPPTVEVKPRRTAAGSQRRRRGGAAAAAKQSDPVSAAIEGATGTALQPVPLEAAGGQGQHPQLPLWLDAAISLGAPFVRVAAAGLPPASAHLHDYAAAGCAACAGEPPPGVDEYYFWLGGSGQFIDTDAVQDATAGVVVSTLDDPQDQTSDWDRPEKLPALLEWQPEPVVYLWWCRVRGGRFEPPRRSSEGVVVPAGPTPALAFCGRTGDSLRFSVPNGVPPVGYSAVDPGFRYDLVPDYAVVLPLVVLPAPPASAFPGQLPAYPYFLFLPPGAPLVPLSRFAVAMTVAGALRAHGRSEAALAWYDLISPPLGQDDAWGDGCPPAASVDDDTARLRAVLLAYLETLVDTADVLLCTGSAESALKARTVLDVAARILGEPPRRVDVQAGDGNDTSTTTSTVAAFDPSPAALNPRLLAIYERCAERAELVRECLDGHRLRTAARRPGGAFWAAPDRDGVLATRFGEPAAFVAGQACDACGAAQACTCSAGRYRFTFLVQKAMELANEVRGLGAALLSAYEKGDSEALTALRAGHERQLFELAVATRQLQWREADWQVQALQKTKQGALTRLAYYQDLLRRGHNAGEVGYEALTGVSTASRVGANVSEGIAQGIGMSPDFWLGVAGIAGSPLQFQQFPLGNKLAAGFSTAARIMNGLAEIANVTGSLSLTEGGWDRREDEWRHQVQVISIELEQIERQILGAERRRDAALRDLNVQQQQAQHAAEVQNFLRDKFTSAELYLYLQRETSGLHRQLYDLALQAARRAQRAFTLERATSPALFLPADPWDGVQRGLLAGERLHVALRHMESTYLEENCREYELTKHVSLRVDFPLAFLQLQQTGYTEIDIPEWMYDLDYPGHYLRRIKNVALTIPAVVGPYTGVHCRLTLLSSQTRIDPRLAIPADACCGRCRSGAPAGAHGRCACPPSGPCRCTSGGRVRVCPCATGACPGCRERPAEGTRRADPSGYALTPDDPRAVRSYVAGEAIATSTGQNDSGLFELLFRDERYLPFEYRGAVGRWRIELPPENNRFPLETLGDVVLRVDYTSRQGGEALRDAAAAAAEIRLPGAGLRLFDARHDFPDEWYALTSRQPNGWEQTASARTFPLRLSRDHFPYLTGGCDAEVTRLDLYVELDEPGCRGALPVTIVTRHIEEHERGGECRCPGETVSCVATAEWPCLFHGTVDVELPLPWRERARPAALLRFPCSAGEITALHVVCRYRRRPAVRERRPLRSGPARPELGRRGGEDGEG